MLWQLCQAESDTVIGDARILSGIMEISLRVMALPDGKSEWDHIITTRTFIEFRGGGWWGVAASKDL